MNIKLRLTAMNFLQFAVWGSYLTSMGTYLFGIGLAENIGIFYAMQGIVSLFMPALIGIVADRWIQAQKLLGICHLLAATFMIATGYYALTAANVEFAPLFTLYSLSVAFYMPTLGLSNSVAYSSLGQAGLDTVKHFPPIRVWGTVGFICAMWCCDLSGFQSTAWQFIQSAVVGIVLGLYAFTMPQCPTNQSAAKKSLVEALGLNAFALFKQKKMALFFTFSILLGVSLQITNGFANPFISDFGQVPEYANTFGVNPRKMASEKYTCEEIIEKNVAVALRAAGDKAKVALDIGPIGEMLEPNGSLTFEEAYEIFARVARAGEKAGCHLAVVETMTELSQIRAAVLAVKENTNLPVFATMSFEKNGRTFSGCTAASCAIALEALGVDALGINCSLAPDEIYPIACEMSRNTHLPLIVKANAGLPDPKTGEYSIDENEFAESLDGKA